MRKITKITNCIFFIVLIASIPFSSTIVLGQQLEAANCGAVKKLEMEQWPVVAYCKTPLEKDGDYRYFVYLNKPDSYTDFKLDVDGMSSFWVEALHQTETGDDVAYWDSGLDKVVVEGNGVFLLHGDGSDLTLTDPSPSDQMVRLYRSESCENLVFQMTTVAEENIFIKIRNVTKDLMFMRAVINSAVASMFQINENTQLPIDYTTQLIQFMQNSVDESGNLVESGGLIAIKNSKIQNFWDLEGYREPGGWFPDSYSQSIIDQVLSDWDNGLYDDVWFVHTHIPNPETVNFFSVFSHNGIDLRLMASPSVGDIGYYKNMRSDYFWLHDMKYLILSSPSPDDLAAGKVYMRLSEIDPSVSDLFKNNQFLDELAKLPNPFDETPIYHPLDMELKGGYKSLYVTLSGDEISVSSIPPASYFGDVIKLSYDQFLDLKTQSFMYEGKTIVSRVNTGDIGKDLGESALSSIVDDLNLLESELQASNFPQATKDTHSTIITNVKNMFLNEINSEFGEDAWATFIYDFGEVQLDASLQVIDGIDDVSNIGQWGLNNGLSVDSQAKNIADDAVESMVYTIENEWGPYLQDEYTFKVGETIDTVPDELSSPLDVAKTNYWSRIAGISFGFLLTLGPYFEYFGREADNYFLYYLGVGLKWLGTATFYVYAVSIGITIYTLASLGGTIAGIGAFLWSAVGIPFITSLIAGLFVSQVLMIIFTLIFFPPQQLCDADHPWYNQAQLQFDRSHITPGEKLKYVYYGTKCGYKCDPDEPGCDPLAWEIDMFLHPDTCDPGFCWVGVSSCNSVDGTCFECETQLELLDPGGNYEVVAQSEYPFTGYQTSSHGLTICPSGYVIDTTPTEKCVFCTDGIETDVFGGTPDNKCELDCGAPPVCDEVNPNGNVNSCGGGNHDLADKCSSDCLTLEDRGDLICRSKYDNPVIGEPAFASDCSGDPRCNGLSMFSESLCPNGEPCYCDTLCDCSCPEETTTTTTLPCSAHYQCSQACTTLCPVNVYGCCYGCQLGQCVDGLCKCVDATSYCSSSPSYQMGDPCTASITVPTDCSGTPDPCSSYVEESFCRNAGCSWGECNFNNDYKCCDSDDSCSSPTWYYMPNSHCGNVGLSSCTCDNDCGTYTTQGSCEGKSYCDWNDVGCFGTPSSCSSHTIQSACEMAGCTWNPVTTTPSSSPRRGGGGGGETPTFGMIDVLNILRRPLDTIITILSEL